MNNAITSKSENLMHVFLYFVKTVAKNGQYFSRNSKETVVCPYRSGWMGLVKSVLSRSGWVGWPKNLMILSVRTLWMTLNREINN